MRVAIVSVVVTCRGVVVASCNRASIGGGPFIWTHSARNVGFIHMNRSCRLKLILSPDIPLSRLAPISRALRLPLCRILILLLSCLKRVIQRLTVAAFLTIPEPVFCCHTDFFVIIVEQIPNVGYTPWRRSLSGLFFLTVLHPAVRVRGRQKVAGPGPYRRITRLLLRCDTCRTSAFRLITFILVGVFVTGQLWLGRFCIILGRW